MHLVSRNAKTGMVKLVPEDLDDIYVLFRIIDQGDRVEAMTSRRLRKSTTEDSRADSGERVTLRVGVKVKAVMFHEFDDSLRVSGTIVSGREDMISMGEHHTLRIRMKTEFVLLKDKWRDTESELLEEALANTRRAKTLIMLIDDEEVLVARISLYSTQVLLKFNSRVTRKSSDAKQHESTKREFFAEIVKAAETIVAGTEPQHIVVAGPGFTKEEFNSFLMQKNVGWRDRVILGHTSSAGRSGLHELIAKGLPEQLAEDHRISIESRLVEEFLTRLAKETGTVTYGSDHVQNAAEMGAVETALILDREIKGLDPDARTKIDELIRAVRNGGGKLEILSSLLPPGERLKGFGGIVALLRFKIPGS